MPRVQVIADDGWLALDEYTTQVQVQPEHARKCLGDRIAWAIEDAVEHAEPEAEPQAD